VYLVTSIKKRAQNKQKAYYMKDKEIVRNLVLTRGGMSKEKRQIILKYFPEASASFLRQSNLVFSIMLLAYVLPNVSTFRIYEFGRINNSIMLRVMIKFKLLDLTIKNSKHLYNITPLTRLIITDLINAYKLNLLTFESLNKIDKKANYIQIKARIKDLKQK
jgi:hypothetical protein